MSSPKRQGFTMIEITLAMAFVSTLLITIALVISQIMTIYQKGLALRAVNSVGRELIDEFSRAINIAPVKGVNFLCSGIYSGSTEAVNNARNACISRGAYLLTYHQDYAQLNVNGTNKEVPLHGTFCTGRYSYIWNTGYALNNGRAETIHLTYGESNTNYQSNNFRLLRIPDDDNRICAQGVSNNNYEYNAPTGDNPVLDFTAGTGGSFEAEPIELLGNSENNLVLYDLVVFPAALHTVTQHSFYSATFILATLSGGVDIMSAGDYCTADPTDDLTTDFNYCAVNKFNFAVRATGELTEEEREERGHY